jgi:hypothetical protein
MTEHRVDLTHLAASLAHGAHSIFGASKSHMYLACPGSLIPNLLEPDESGFDAAYGTVGHSVTETWLRSGRRPDHLIGTNEFIESGEWGHLIDIDEEMLGFAEQCVDRCEWEPGEQIIERRVDFSHLTPIPHQGGYLDFAALVPRRATTIDHKFGASPENMVYAEDNPQLMLYSIGLWRDPEFEHYDLQDFIIRINQPRLNHFDEWHTTAKRLAEFEDYCRERMALAWTLDAPRVPGAKQCRFCKIKGSCAANAKLQEDLTAAVFTDMTQDAKAMKSFIARLDGDIEPFSMKFNPVGTLTTEQMARLLPYRAMAESWWKALAAELNKRAQAGDVPSTMKIVEGRSHRQFVDEDAAKNKLLKLGLKRSDIITESMVSPNQAETLLRKKGFKTKELPELLHGLVRKPPGRATLVPLTDKRPMVEDVTALVFEAVETTETDKEL